MSRREPTLEDMLAEPIVRLVMARDGVDPEEVKALMRTVKRTSVGRRRDRV